MWYSTFGLEEIYLRLSKFILGKMRKSISNRLFKFLYCLEDELWLLPLFTYFFKYFNRFFILFSISFKYYFFIHYFFFNNYTSSNIFFIQHLIIIIEKKIWKMNNNSSNLMNYCSLIKKFWYIERLLEHFFLFSLSIIEIILHMGDALKGWYWSCNGSREKLDGEVGVCTSENLWSWR